MNKVLIAVGVFTLASSAFARKVTIPLDGTLKLMNTSAATVTYNVSCKDKDGLVIAGLAATGSTLAAGKSTTIGGASGSGLCGSGWTQVDITGATANMKTCNVGTSVSFSTALTNACAANATMCSLSQIASNVGTATYLNGAFKSTGTWSQYDSNNSTWTNYSGNTSNYGNSKYSPGAANKFSDGANGTGATVLPDYGWVSATLTDPVGSVLCCALYSDLSQCEIEITSPTGHLSSPNFIGGKAF